MFTAYTAMSVYYIYIYIYNIYIYTCYMYISYININIAQVWVIYMQLTSPGPDQPPLSWFIYHRPQDNYLPSACPRPICVLFGESAGRGLRPHQPRPRPPTVCVGGARRRSLFPALAPITSTEVDGNWAVKNYMYMNQQFTKEGRVGGSFSLIRCTVRCSWFRIKWLTERYSRKPRCFKAPLNKGQRCLEQ